MWAANSYSLIPSAGSASGFLSRMDWGMTCEISSSTDFDADHFEHGFEVFFVADADVAFGKLVEHSYHQLVIVVGCAGRRVIPMQKYYFYEDRKRLPGLYFPPHAACVRRILPGGVPASAG